MADGTTIIDTLLADINAVIPNFSSLVSSYRLLVGSAEEIQRIPGVPFEIFERAVIRFDRAGTLIDILLELLCCKIAFSSEFLAVTCAPVDILRLAANCGPCSSQDDPCRTVEQILVLEVLRQLLYSNCINQSCFGPPPPGIKPPKPEPPPPTAPPDESTAPAREAEESSTIAQSHPSPLTRRHI